MPILWIALFTVTTMRRARRTGRDRVWLGTMDAPQGRAPDDGAAAA